MLTCKQTYIAFCTKIHCANGYMLRNFINALPHTGSRRYYQQRPERQESRGIPHTFPGNYPSKFGHRKNTRKTLSAFVLFEELKKGRTAEKPKTERCSVFIACVTILKFFQGFRPFSGALNKRNALIIFTIFFVVFGTFFRCSNLTGYLSVW